MATYSRVNWADSPSTTTPVSAADLNVMDAGIASAFANMPQIGTGNGATSPVFTFIVVGPDSSHLPAAGTKNRIAFVVPYTP